jgi:catechol 2,3-dioxygenase-like lactoylglutathione lyase family enzyme
MELGGFSLSLAVADLGASRAFYEKLGFEVTGGDADQNWLILANGTTILGLFHGMFDQNILTFTPGLTNEKQQLETFTDVREIQAGLLAAGIELDEQVAADNAAGAAHVRLRDPDGNAILIDQFF